MADCAAAGAPLSSPAPSAHRCAAAGLDSGPPAERLASMPFDGAVDRLELARPRTGSAGDRWRRLGLGLTRFGGHPEALAGGAADAKNTSTVFAGVSPTDGRPRPCWT